MAEESFIPPGQEELIGAMLGNGAALPGDCRLVNGDIQKKIVNATFACQSGEVVVELAHRDAAPAGSTRTEKFALRIGKGTPPPDLQNVLLSRIREREGQFNWTVYQNAPPSSRPTTGPVPVLSGAVVLGVIVLAALLLWRRRGRAKRV